MEDRDRRRWQSADENSDGTLNKLEFKHFLHPEESDHMRDIVVSETLDDIDKDGDGLISLVILACSFLKFQLKECFLNISRITFST